MAAETIGDRVNDVWEAIKKFFRDLRDKIKELWVKYVTAVGRLKRSAEAMRRKVSQTNGTAKEDSFTDKSMASKVLDKNGKVNLADTLANTIKEITQTTEIKDELIKAIEDENNVVNLKKKINSYATLTNDRNGKDIPDDKVMVGNKGIEYYMDTADDKVTFDIFEAVYDNDQDGDTEIEVLSKASLEKICTEVIKVCNAITSVHDRKENGDKKVEKELDKRAKTNEYADKKGVLFNVGKKNMRDARVVRELLRANSKMSYLPEKIAISGCHVALSYVNKALRQYGK
jgi:Ca2+-binding RTX toxin-like protein